MKYLDYIFKCGKSRIDYILEITGLEQHKHQKVKKYSTGMKQRLGLGMAIFRNPELLILDEPLNGLDPQGIHEMRELLIRLKNEGKTIFISSHILSEIEKTCTHIGILNDGKLVYQDSMQKLLQEYSEEKIFIKTNDSINAERICREHLINSKIISANILCLDLGQNKYHEIVNILSQNGIDIFSIEKRGQDLESIFLNLITR